MIYHERPPLSGIDVLTTLADFAIVSYAVEPADLAKHLPPDFTPEVVTLADGRKAAFVSAVPFRDLDFRFNAFPAARFTFAQTNYRAYVRYRGERCAWFFGTTLASAWVAIPRYLWKLPWHLARTTISAEWSNERCSRYELHTEGSWGRATLRAGPLNGEPPFASFADPAEAEYILTHPMRGFYMRRDGRLGSYRIWHDRLRVGLAQAQSATFEVFTNLGLVAANAQPHSVLLQRETEFAIYLPPRSLA